VKKRESWVKEKKPKTKAGGKGRNRRSAYETCSLRRRLQSGGCSLSTADLRHNARLGRKEVGRGTRSSGHSKPQEPVKKNPMFREAPGRKNRKKKLGKMIKGKSEQKRNRRPR